MPISNRMILLMPVMALAAFAAGCRGCDGSDPSKRELANPIDECGKTLAAIAQLPQERLSEWPDLYAQGCAGLYRQPRCHAAWLALSDAAAPDRTREVILACADDYCPMMQQPAPALCSVDRNVTGAAQLTALWSELHAFILAIELGTTPDAGAVVALNRLFVPISIPVDHPGEASPSQPAVVIRMVLAGGKIEVAIGRDGGEKKWTIPVSPSESDMKSLKQEFVHEAPTPESRAVIESSGDVPYGAVMKVLEAAKEAGYSKIALSVSGL